VFNEQKILI
jgi:hypothetical protein